MQRTSTKWQSRELDPVIGRDEEIEEYSNTNPVTWKKNNPMLVGEPEGKTAIAEGLPIELKDGDVKE
jgi:ATP-dependent Clp protease ATP-binding subunit ClpA